jgi:hypothetical protein
MARRLRSFPAVSISAASWLVSSVAMVWLMCA